MRKIFFIVSLWFASVGVLGQTKLSPYTRYYKAQQRRNIVSDSIRQDTKISAFIGLTDDYVPGEFDQWGIQVRTVTGNLLTADIPVAQLDEFAKLERVKYIEAGSPVHSQLDKAKASAGVDKVKTGVELPQEFRGKDIVIGVIDNGFDYGHADFWTADKTSLRIKRVWDQNKDGDKPEGFDYGCEYDTQDEILTAAFDNTRQTHGTHVVGIASGADETDGHDFAGVASDAEIVLVSLNTDDMEEGDNTKVIDGLNYIYKYAEAQQKPCVVNVSLGSHLGPRDGSSAFDQMADKLQGPGKLLVGSVGNDGASKCHVSQHFTPEGNDTLKTFFDFKYSYPQYMTMEIWGDPNMELIFIPVIYNAKTNAVTSTGEPFVLTAGQTGDKVYSFSAETDGVSGSVSLFTEINTYNQRPHLFVKCDFTKNDEYHKGFYITSSTEGSVHAWTDNVYGQFTNKGIEAFQDGNGESTMGEIGGSGKRIISVGAYATRDHSQHMGIIYPSGEKVNEIASFSSPGPTPDGRLKPEITAPGTYIVSALSNYYSGSKQIEKRIEWNGEKYSFGYMQGTSMASPFVAGVLATWLQAYPEMTPEVAKEILAETAICDEYTGENPETDSESWGYGKLDAWNGLKECIKRATSIEALPADIDAFVVCTGTQSVRVLFTRSDRQVHCTIYDLDGRVRKQATQQQVAPGEEMVLGTESFEQGIYLLSVTTGNGLSECKQILINQ